MKSFAENARLVASVVGLCAAMSITGATGEEKVVFQVSLSGVKTGHSPLYISVQDAGQFRTQDGAAGAILREQESTETIVDLEVEPGAYAISVWHDLDEDGEFSRGENYWPTDGWGASGTYPEDRAPSFEEMKVDILQNGRVVMIDMQYYER